MLSLLTEHSMQINPVPLKYGDLYGELPIPVRKGYKFIGWHYAESDGGTIVSPEDIYDIGTDYTLHAKWEASEPFVESVVTVKGDVYTINSEVYHAEGSAVMVVGYKDGQMVDKTSVPCGADMPDAKLNGDIDEIKVMVWDALGSFKPVCEMEVIPESEFVTE